MALIFLGACSEEKKEQLPDLPAVELSKEVPGYYSGFLPCEDCNSKSVKMTLNEDNTVEVIQSTLKDTVEELSFKGVFVVTDSIVKVSLAGDSIHWNFKRISSGNLSYLTSAGTVYEDENGLRADFVRIYKPVSKTTDSTKE